MFPLSFALLTAASAQVGAVDIGPDLIEDGGDGAVGTAGTAVGGGDTSYGALEVIGPAALEYRGRE